MTKVNSFYSDVLAVPSQTYRSIDTRHRKIYCGQSCDFNIFQFPVAIKQINVDVNLLKNIKFLK